MKKMVLGIAGGSALVVGLVTANIADADNHSASATLATADGLEIGTVEFTTEDGHTDLRGYRRNVDHLAFGNDAQGIFRTAGINNERHPQS